jgi:hypothetical protein
MAGSPGGLLSPRHQSCTGAAFARKLTLGISFDTRIPESGDVGPKVPYSSAAKSREPSLVTTLEASYDVGASGAP